jgi:lactate permease
MWYQDINPLNGQWLSALIAVIPILVFLLCLVALKMKGITAGIIALVFQIVIAIWPFGMPIGSVAGAGLVGILTAIWPIAYIIALAVWLYRLTVASGRFDTVRSSIAGVSHDQRIQVLLVSFGFGAFLEGAAGFGVPIAICAALLVQLGFHPVKAAMLSLVSNVASGAYGAIGIPVIVAAKVGGVNLADLSYDLVLVLQLVTLATPFILVMILDGWRGLRETWPITLAVSLTYSATQAGLLIFLGPELADILPGLLAMIMVVLVGRFWKPSNIYREDNSPTPIIVKEGLKKILVAWSPFYILTAAIFVWSIPAFKALFSADGSLSWLVIKFSLPGVTGVIVPNGETEASTATWAFTPISATGTAILIAIIITFLTTPQLHFSDLRKTLAETLNALWRSIFLIALILALANIANLSGGTASIGIALSGVGLAFPLLSPIIGWFGVFITGSVVNNNTLFAQLQSVTATKIGVDPTLLVAANTAGGSVAKVISPQSIAIAAGAVGLTGREGEILRASIKYSLGMLVFVCVWVMLLSFITH